MGVISSQQMSPGMRFFFCRIFPLIFISVGGLVLYLGCKDLERAKQSTIWPTAQGVIQHSSVEYQHSDKGGGTYHAEVMYNFMINGTTFSGNRVAFGDYDSSNSSHAQNIVNKYPQDKPVTVYYMKENPEVCVLEPGVKGQIWFLPVCGLVFFGAGILMAIFLPKALRQ